MKQIILSFFLILFYLSSFAQKFDNVRIMEIKASFQDEKLARIIDERKITGDIYLYAGYAILYATPEQATELEQIGFRIEILKDDIEAFADNFWSSRDQYHSYEDIIATINSLVNVNPSICKKYIYGSSVEGRELAALKISDNVDTDETEPEILFDGGIHGDEVGGAENLVRFAEFLCESYTSNPDIAELINNREIWLYMMVNPDGRVNMTRYNSYGVDLNRDWGYMWAGDGSSPDYYSQVETRAIRNCLLENQFVIHTSYHSGTEFLAYPWSYRPEPAPDQAHIHYLAGIYSASSGYTNLPYEQGYSGMYQINGSSKDAGYATMGAISWTMEISLDKQPPPSQIQYFYEINEPAMLAMIENAGFGISGIVTDASNGEAVPAVIFVEDFYPTYSDPVNGDYHKYLTAGTYQVTAFANGYVPATSTVTVTENNVTNLDFALVPQYNHFAYRVIASHMPVDNFEDELYSAAALRGPDGVCYSLSRWGWIILDMQQVIMDGPANEIIIHEGDSSPEGFTCFASSSMDGPWHLIGGGTGTTSFDFGAAGITEARYIKVLDDGDGETTGADAGFDLDAVEAPQQPQIVFLAIDAEINDIGGNSDSRIDPGENFDLIITLRNQGGIAMEDGQVWLTIDPQFLSEGASELLVESLEPGDSLQLSFPMGCSSFCPSGELLMTVLNIYANSGLYSESFPVNFTAGAIIEDWETGNMLKFNWTPGGNKPWAINFQSPHQGSYSARSGNIDDGQESSIMVTMDVIGYDDISFFSKVSSEQGADYLKFFIDNNLKGSWSGEAGWEYYEYDVKPGIHTFKWSFIKDGLNTIGQDAGWIDYIVFPSCNLDGELKVLANGNPRQHCGPGQSQLGAFILGGSIQTVFSWSPSSSLDDPQLQFPVCQAESTTLYSVIVTDGSQTAESETLIEILPIPDPPEIFQQGDSLISSVDIGNQWYDLNGPLDGETGKVFYPQSEGNYYSIVNSEDGCPSEPSNTINFIFTGIDGDRIKSSIGVFPNPFNDEIHIRFSQVPDNTINVSLTDLTGRMIFQKNYNKEEIGEELIIPLNLNQKGLILLKISGPEHQVLTARKLLKL